MFDCRKRPPWRSARSRNGTESDPYRIVDGIRCAPAAAVNPAEIAFGSGWLNFSDYSADKGRARTLKGGIPNAWIKVVVGPRMRTDAVGFGVLRMYQRLRLRNVRHVRGRMRPDCPPPAMPGELRRRLLWPDTRLLLRPGTQRLRFVRLRRLQRLPAELLLPSASLAGRHVLVQLLERRPLRRL